MQEYLDGDSLYAHIKMLRAADARTIVLLEGWDDCRTVDPHISAESCQTLPAYSRANLERAIGLVDAQSDERVLGVLDRDLVDIIEKALESDNVVYTDLYDLDATIAFSGDVGTRVIAVYTDREAVSKHLAESGCSTPLENAVRIAAVIGVLRLLSIRDGRNLSVRRLPIEAIVTSTGDVDQSRLATVVAARSVETGYSADDIEKFLTDEPEPGEPAERLCSGHDLAAALAWLMRAKWGAGAVGQKNVATTIRAALSCETLKTTRLYTAVREWADARGTRVWSCA